MNRVFHLLFINLVTSTSLMAGSGAAKPPAMVTAANQACRPVPADFSTPATLARTAPASLWSDWHYGPITLTATPTTALIDQPLTIRVTGLKPGEPITLEARTTGFQHIAWHSSATFIANRKGVVDVSHMAPRYGDYSGVHAMGLVWSMLPDQAQKPADAAYYMPRKGAKLSLTALATGRKLAAAAVLRLSRSPDIREHKLDSHGLVGYFFEPSGHGKHPAVIVIGGSEGGLQPQVAEAALLASHGYAALGLAYFRGYATQNPLLAKLPRELVKIPLEYFKHAANWLLKQPGVAGKRVGIMGWSKGAEAALLLASTWPKTFGAVVADAPSSEVWEGIHQGPGAYHSSWTLDGKPVPFASFRAGPDIYDPANKTITLLDGYLKPMLNGKGLAGAAIPVGKIAGPVLLLSGTDDKIWPSSLFAARIMTRLEKHRRPYADASLCYRGAGHYVAMWPYRPTLTTGFAAGPMSIVMGGNQIAYAYAESDAWPRILAFLHKAMNQEVPRHD